YERLIERGIDPESEDAAKSPSELWPTRDDVIAYGSRSDELIAHALCDGAIERDDVPQLRNAEAALAILEHEQMHQETLLYMFHNLPYERKRRVRLPGSQVAELPGSLGNSAMRQPGNPFVGIPAGIATLGADATHIGFAWDNELPELRVGVDAFSIQKYNVTNGEYLEFVEAGGTAPYFRLRGDGAWIYR